MKIQVGDSVSLKAAILFNLERYLLDKMASTEFPIGVIAWGREGFGDDEVKKRVVSFIEPPKPDEIPDVPTNSNLRSFQWTIFVQGMLPDSLDRPTLPAYEMCADIKRALIELSEHSAGAFGVNNILGLGPGAQKNLGFRSNISDLKIGSETVRGSGDHSRYTFFWIPLYFTITEDLKNPRVTIQNQI